MTKLHLLFCLLLFISFTNSKLTVKEQDNLQTMADVQKIATDSFRLTAMIINFFHFNKVGALWYTYQIKLLQYPRYLEISYPDRAAFMLAQSDYDLFTVPDISQPPDKVIEKATYYTVPIQFLAFGNLSNFLINFWLYMMILAIILVGIVIAIVLDFCTKPSKALHPIFAKFNQALKWNYLIAIFIGNFSDIALWTSLNMKTVEFANYFEWFSFFECILVNIGVITVIVRLGFIVNRLRKEKAEAVKTGSSWQLDLYKQNMKEYTMVFDDFKDESLLQQSYILVFMVKLYIFYVIIAYLYKYPFAQTIIINIIGIANLVYLAFVRPFKGKIDLISAILQESILELMNLCVFALALADEKGYIIADFRTTMGDIIIGCNMAFMFLGAIYLLILALFVLKDIYIWMAKECCDHKVAPYNINIIPAEKQQQNTKTEPNSSYSANESNLYLNRPTRPTKSSKPERKVRYDPGVNVSQYEQRETFGGYENDRSFENHEYYQSKYQEQEPEPILHNPFVKDPYENKPNQGSREKIYYVEDPSGVFNDVLRLSPLDLANSNIGADYRLNVGSPKNKDDEYQLEPVWKKKNPFGSQSKQNLFS